MTDGFDRSSEPVPLLAKTLVHLWGAGHVAVGGWYLYALYTAGAGGVIRPTGSSSGGGFEEFVIWCIFLGPLWAALGELCLAPLLLLARWAESRSASDHSSMALGIISALFFGAVVAYWALSNEKESHRRGGGAPSQVEEPANVATSDGHPTRPSDGGPAGSQLERALRVRDLSALLEVLPPDQAGGQADWNVAILSVSVAMASYNECMALSTLRPPKGTDAQCLATKSVALEAARRLLSRPVPETPPVWPAEVIESAMTNATIQAFVEAAASGRPLPARAHGKESELSARFGLQHSLSSALMLDPNGEHERTANGHVRVYWHGFLLSVAGVAVGARHRIADQPTLDLARKALRSACAPGAAITGEREARRIEACDSLGGGLDVLQNEIDEPNARALESIKHEGTAVAPDGSTFACPKGSAVHEDRTAAGGTVFTCRKADGTPVGPMRAWHANGADAGHGEFRSGTLERMSMTFASGARQADYRVAYRWGNQYREMRGWWETGTPKAVLHMANWKAHGKSQTWKLGGTFESGRCSDRDKTVWQTANESEFKTRECKTEWSLNDPGMRARPKADEY